MNGNIIELLVAFPVIWSATTILVSWISGWSRLARAYPHQPQLDGECFRYQTIHMANKSRYHSNVTIGATPRGLHLAIQFLFRPGHRKIFVPWPEVSLHGGYEPRVALKFARKPDIPLIMHRSLAEKIAAASDGAFQLPGKP